MKKQSHFWSDDALASAGPPVKWRAKTLKEMHERFPDLPIVQVWDSQEFKLVTWDQMFQRFIEGTITEDIWKAYQVIWRNTTPRISGLSQEFEF